MVIHDDTLDRTTSGHGHVRDHTLTEIRGLRVSHPNNVYSSERVPSLDEVMIWARGAGVTLSLEIKQPAPVGGRPKYPRIAERVADLLTAHAMAERTLVHSFDHPTVLEMRGLLPNLATAVNYGGGTFTDPLVLGAAADASGIGAGRCTRTPGAWPNRPTRTRSRSSSGRGSTRSIPLTLGSCGRSWPRSPSPPGAPPRAPEAVSPSTTTA